MSNLRYIEESKTASYISGVTDGIQFLLAEQWEAKRQNGVNTKEVAEKYTSIMLNSGHLDLASDNQAIYNESDVSQAIAFAVKSVLGKIPAFSGCGDADFNGFVANFTEQATQEYFGNK